MRILIGLMAISLILLTGCYVEDDDRVDHRIVYDYENTPPGAPKGFQTVTHDGYVELLWIPNDESDLDGYEIFRSRNENGPFNYAIAFTRDDYYLDYDVVNGNTYYYGVRAVDVYGDYSELSWLTFDTPRPEGYNAKLYSMIENPAYGGFDFSQGKVVDGNSENADIIFSYTPETNYFYIQITYTDIDIQDFGYTESLDEVDYSPVGENAGWSLVGEVEAIPGHSYIVWTAENHFAKFRIKSVSSSYVVMDWAYQVDTGNPELK